MSSQSQNKFFSANCMSVVVLQYTVVLDVKTVLSLNSENYNCKLLKFLSLFPFGFFLSFREIEPTVSYKLFLIKKFVYR